MAKIPTSKPSQLRLTSKEPTLLFAIQDLVHTGGMNFEEWWDEFKLGFPKRTQGKHTNYPIKDWVKPKYVELVPLGEQNKANCREIEYFPDADDESISYLIRGNDADLIRHITTIGYQQQATNSSPIPGKNSNAPLKGFPALELLFVGDRDDKKKTGLKIIRCPGFTDNEKIAQMKLAELIKPSDITRWAQKIKTIFGDSNYLWRKGQNCVSYTGHVARLQGLAGHAFVRTEADGVALFTALLKIHDAMPDKQGFNYSEKIDKSQFNKQKRTTKILNKSITLDLEREVADCYFYEAKLRLPLLKKPISLVRKSVIVYK